MGGGSFSEEILIKMVGSSVKFNVGYFQIALTVLSLTLCALYDESAEFDLLGRRRSLQEVDLGANTTIDMVTGRPVHKDLFPMNSADFWGTIFVGLGSMIAASGGIGGGGMLVPLLILIFDFHPKYAIPLSNFTIVGSSITNMWMNLSKRHPDVDRPCVDWDLILVMEPLTMVGAVVGAFMSKVLDEIVLSVSLVILLAVTTKTTLDKGISQWNKETATFELEKKGAVQQALEAEVELRQRDSLLGDQDSELSDPDDSGSDTNKSTNSSLGVKVDIVSPSSSKKSLTTATRRATSSSPKSVEDELIDSIGTQFEEDEVSAGARRLEQQALESELAALLNEERDTPMDKMKVIAGMVLGVILLNLIKGGKRGVFDSPLGIECGSNAYWFIQLMVVVLVLCVSNWARNYLIERWRTKTRLGYKYAPGDVEWNEHNTVKYPSYCFFAGFFAGMFGVGGGIVKGPLMLHMGVNPMVASATVAVMIMFTSVSATAMFIAFGTLKWDYAWFLFFVGLITTCVGQFIVSAAVKKYRRVSLVSLSIGAVVALSTVLMALQSILALTDANREPTDNSVCG